MNNFVLLSIARKVRLLTLTFNDSFEKSWMSLPVFYEKQQLRFESAHDLQVLDQVSLVVSFRLLLEGPGFILIMLRMVLELGISQFSRVITLRFNIQLGLLRLLLLLGVRWLLGLLPK